MTRRATGATDGPSLSHMRPPPVRKWHGDDSTIYLFTPLLAFTHIRALTPALGPFLLFVIARFSLFSEDGNKNEGADSFDCKPKDRETVRRSPFRIRSCVLHRVGI